MKRDERIEAAKRYGAKRGWTGRNGGWIYTAAGRAIAQGWLAIHFRYRNAIDMEEAAAE